MTQNAEKTEKETIKMKKSGTSKKALLLSLLSLVMCCAMLVGSTFAWFTDSVTSGSNKIVAGNLDVALYHDVDGVETEVTGGTVLFATNAAGETFNWEPGAVAYETFTVKNVGSLALKYKLALKDVAKNFVVDATGETTKSLVDVIKVAVTTDEITDRDHAIEGKTFTSLEDFEAPTGSLEPEGEASFTVILYWQPNVMNDDDYNLKNGLTASDFKGDPATSLMIEFATELTASQYTYESDSFDDQYDGDATDKNGDVIVLTSETKPVTENKPFTFTMPGNTATGTGALTAQFPEGSLKDANPHTVELIAETTKPYEGEEPDLTKQAIANVELTLLVDETEVHNFSGKTVTITTYIPQDLLNVEVVYKGETDEVLDGTTYEKSTGKLTFQTNHFSLFEIRSTRLMTVEEEQKAAEGYIFKVDENYYKDLDGFAIQLSNTYKRYRVPVKEGGTFKILADTELKYTLCIGEEANEEATVDLTGHTVTFLRSKGHTGDALGFNVQYSANHVTIQNGAIKAWSTGDGSGGAAIFGREKGFTLRNLDITNIGYTSNGKDEYHYAVNCGSDAGQSRQSYIYDCNIHGSIIVGSQSYLNIYNTVIDNQIRIMTNSHLYLDGVTVLENLYSGGPYKDSIEIKSGHFKTLPDRKYQLAEGSTMTFNEETGMYDVVAN